MAKRVVKKPGTTVVRGGHRGRWIAGIAVLVTVLAVDKAKFHVFQHLFGSGGASVAGWVIMIAAIIFLAGKALRDRS